MMDPNTLFNHRQSENPCLSKNCGEAGCVFNNRSQPVCMCQDTLLPPVNLRCNRTVRQAVDPNGQAIDPEFQSVPLPVPREQPPPLPRINISIALNKPTGQQESSIGNAFQMVHIIAPIIGSLTLISVICIAVIVRMRKKRFARTPKLRTASISWIHKQDSVSLLDNMVVVSKNPHYCSHDVDDAIVAELHDKQISRDKMRLLEEIGEGAFGKVYRGEVTWSDDHMTMVAVKILKSDASRETKEDFRREVKIMSSFDHENILKLIGVVPTEDDSPYMIFEYMEHGDLTELLRKNDPIISGKQGVRLKQTELIDIATQIANGMVYLASRHFVHRDLATRNCLVGSDLVVKISDFGMSRDIYTCDYYKIGGARMLPVRWMSPESMKYGRFTTESDVWAYGVVLWEIFTCGKQPHYGHPNEEVIRFIEDGILLQKPSGCPETLYHVMLGCWRRDPSERFSFERTYNLLVDYQKEIMKYARHMSIQRIADVEDA